MKLHGGLTMMTSQMSSKLIKMFLVPKKRYHGLTHEILPGSTQENPFKNIMA